MWCVPLFAITYPWDFCRKHWFGMVFVLLGFRRAWGIRLCIMRFAMWIFLPSEKKTGVIFWWHGVQHFQKLVIQDVIIAASFVVSEGHVMSSYNVSLSISLHSQNYILPSWMGSHLKYFYYSINYSCWVFLCWRESFISNCRLNIKQLLGRCWISSPPQLEKLIFLYMWCPRMWCDPDLLPHQMYKTMWILGLRMYDNT